MLGGVGPVGDIGGMVSGPMVGLKVEVGGGSVGPESGSGCEFGLMMGRGGSLQHGPWGGFGLASGVTMVV